MRRHLVVLKRGDFAMEKSTKAAVQSTTICGSIVTIVGAVGSYLELAGKLPLGGAAPIVSAIGALLSIFGRCKSDIKPISGLF